MGVLSVEQVLTEEAEAIQGGTRHQTLDELRDRFHRATAAHEAAPQRGNGDEGLPGDGADTSDAVKSRKEFYCTLNKLNRAALCFSGGGIRSATFCLGVLQALAGHTVDDSTDYSHGDGGDGDGELRAHGEKKPNQSLLNRFHYLSTVSGGGYIGSWLSAWRHYEDFPTVLERLRGRPDGPDMEPEEISWLRAYSNYLTPRVGLTSTDTWTGVAVYLRNLLLNWLVIIPALAVLLVALKFLMTASVGLAGLKHPWLHYGIGAAGIAALVIAQRFTIGHRPTVQEERTDEIPINGIDLARRRFLWGDLLWRFVSAVLLTSALTSLTGALRFGSLHTYEAIYFGAIFGEVIFAVGWMAGWPLRRPRADLALEPAGAILDFAAWATSGAIYGGLVGLGARLYATMTPYSLGGPSLWAILLPIIFGVPWILVSQLLAETTFTGLTSYETDSDADRESFARVAGWVIVSATAWIVTTFIVFAAGYFFLEAGLGKDLAPYLASAGGIAGVVSAWIAKRATAVAKTAAKTVTDTDANTAAKPKDRRPVPTIVLVIAGPLFAAALVIGLSVCLDLLLLGDSLIKRLASNTFEVGPTLLWLAVGGIAAFVIAGVASRTININRFSMHAFYRNRLVRAYLGAVHKRRRPDRFTGFDAKDNLPVSCLWPPKSTAEAGDGGCLYHVLNMTLNVVNDRRLAWQQRKAEPFTVSPLHSGAANKGYRKSDEYAGPTGISLGTAMAISGAAASPNMGYHSSPSLTLLLALFNVRFGWWLGNPGKEGATTYIHEGPRTAIRPLLEETFGLTTDRKPWVYLSDGGHFENLGIYEMVRRRCRFILAIDASCDPEFQFEDLGNALRKIYIDLGIRIRLADLDKLKNHPSEQELSQSKGSIPYYVKGTIGYKDADGEGSEDGTLLYIKPAFHGTSSTEGAGLRSYAMEHADFPHESTADQWFSESQFESYRTLALDIMSDVLKDPKSLAGLTTPRPATRPIMATYWESSRTFYFTGR